MKTMLRRFVQGLFQITPGHDRGGSPGTGTLTSATCTVNPVLQNRNGSSSPFDAADTGTEVRLP
jgi:hypothetical protein